jgi:nucleoside-diphosphate-sugar epimerase
VRHALVTGCAGFIGSHLCERLLADGWRVTGVDSFTDYYDPLRKLDNLRGFRDDPDFDLVECDLATAPLDGLLAGVDTVWHLAGQPGVRASFGDGFTDYLHANVLGTQRLLEAAAEHGGLHRFVYASSSSVYGNAAEMPTTERCPLRPVSPYGMTKVATETLAHTYFDLFGVPVVGLRYFTVYGPRQRPDMAFSRFIAAGIEGRPLTIHGSGEQLRDFTFVEDIVDATVAAGETGRPGAAYNVGGGRPVPLNHAIGLLARALDRPLLVEHHDSACGDARATGADASRCERDLGVSPSVPLEVGIERQVAWALETAAVRVRVAAA